MAGSLFVARLCQTIRATVASFDRFSGTNLNRTLRSSPFPSHFVKRSSNVKSWPELVHTAEKSDRYNADKVCNPPMSVRFPVRLFQSPDPSTLFPVNFIRELPAKSLETQGF
jgi:hypothetical protein